MSGLCGWLSRDYDRTVSLDKTYRDLRRMAAPLSLLDGSPTRVQSHACGAQALAGLGTSGHMYRHVGLLVTIWGRPKLAGSPHQIAARLAERWPSEGSAVCRELTGPFALSIVDTAAGQALLAIDRSGTHSLHYQRLPQGLIFASSSQCLQMHGHATRELDPQALYNYLYFHMVPAPRTIYRGQHRLLPGEFLHYDNGTERRGKYWELCFDEQNSAPFEELRSRFVDTLHASVRETLGAHNIGAFLSGGTDSSTLAAILGQVSAKPVRTYSIGFAAPGYDEMDYARLASSHFHTEHHELYVSADDVLAAVPQIAMGCDQPFGNASIVPAFCCARMARSDGITRLLGGDGGDELFGGNERYAHQAVLARYERLPSALRQVIIEPLLFHLAAGRQRGLLRKARRYIEQASLTMPARLDVYNLLQHYGPATVLEPDFLARIAPGEPLAILRDWYWKTDGLSQINRMLALDMKFALADNDLPKVSKACELAGLEVAFPLLSDALLEFATRLAPDQKLKGTRLRPFFKRALRDTLPSAILRKKKHGFGLPFGYWLSQHAGVRELAYDSLSDLKRRRLVRASFIDALLIQHMGQHPAYHGTMVWVLMMLEQWLRQHESRYASRLEVQDELEIRQG